MPAGVQGRDRTSVNIQLDRMPGQEALRGQQRRVSLTDMVVTELLPVLEPGQRRCCPRTHGGVLMSRHLPSQKLFLVAAVPALISALVMVGMHWVLAAQKQPAPKTTAAPVT